jgi:hypothetical protein
MNIEIGTTVLHPDQWTRKEFPNGTVIEIGAAGTYREGKARVKWNGVRNLRTWVALNRLALAR